MMAECRTLEKKNQSLLKPDLVVGQQIFSLTGHQQPNQKVDDDVANSWICFSCWIVRKYISKSSS